MKIYTSDTSDQIPWASLPASDYARRLLVPLMREGTRPFIANVAAEVQVAVVNATVLPLTVVNHPPSITNSYVCSPTTHYIDYAQREVAIELSPHPLLQRAVSPTLAALRPLFHWSQIEQAVYVNNWLLSTNLYPPLTPAMLDTLTAQLVQRFPEHAIVFRSLNDALHGDSIAHLRRRGYAQVFSRQVYLLDPREPTHHRRSNVKQDRKLARRTAYRWRDASELTVGDAKRLQALYADLYLAKYSMYNPQFTVRFVREALEQQWLTLWALEHDGQIDGVLGFTERNGFVTAPLIGYDRSRDQALGLYRMIALKLYDEAAARGLAIHRSSGAASFKRLRGAQPTLEYNLVYQQHLAPRRQVAWQLLAWLSQRAIIPVVRHYGL